MQHVLNDIFILLASEWWLTTEHDKHDDTHTPDIALGRITSLQDFWCNIIRSAVGLVHYFIRNDTLCQAKIDELDVAIVVLFVQEEVLGLNITMANGVSVQVA